ncbi:ATP-binding protein [Sphingomonas rosea]
MNEHSIVRSMVLRTAGGLPESSPLAAALLEWATPHRDWLTPGRVDDLDWPALLASLAEPRAVEEPSQSLDLVGALAALLELPPFDAALLTAMVACDRLPRVTLLTRILGKHGHHLPTLLGEVAGAPPNEAERLVRRSAPIRLDLAEFILNRQGELEVMVSWPLERLLDRAPNGGAEMLETLVGQRQPPVLGLADFAHVAHADFLVRLLRGAVSQRECGINVLIHGPPGTGKTEFARTLAHAAGATLHGVGEADDDGEEPSRWDRIAALTLSQRLLAGRGNAVLLFDEMEDLIGDARPSGGDWVSRRQGSKVFVNRLLETNKVPVIWTTNAIGNVDGAILRRMSFVLKFDLPNRRAAEAMLARVTREEAVAPSPRLTALLAAAPETATVLRVASRAGRLAGDVDGGATAAEALVRALRGGDLAPPPPADFDLDLLESDHSIASLFGSIGRHDAVAILLSGPPGTGKTAFAHHLAEAIDRPLLVKRASDLLSKWVGETEAQIAGAFAEARQRGALLLFDEADSLLFDRATARTSWEVGQVNELLTWLDLHPLPVVAATNYVERLDPATLRRFVFKVRLDPMSPARAARAFERFFGMPAPRSLGEVSGLTPGDFQVVKRQLRFMPASGGQELVDRLRVEAEAKRGRSVRVGF